jgi:hypothetical protein
MKEVMGSLGRDTLAMACMSFRSRMKAVFTADGSFIEYDFLSIKSVDIQLYYFHLKERRKKFRIYRCHPV